MNVVFDDFLGFGGFVLLVDLSVGRDEMRDEGGMKVLVRTSVPATLMG